MNLSRKLTSEEEQLRAELVELEERIRIKIRKITWTHQKLPFDRLAKGRKLREACISAISYLEVGDEENLRAFLSLLTESGITLKSWNGIKS